MALTSPGVQVTVIDESFYTTAQLGTTPLIIVASAENKTNASGTGIAQGTLKSNAGKAYLVSSQRDLAELFGDPTFHVDSNNNPIHAGELNEYGLQAAYSFLGVSNAAFIVRADIDLNTLAPTSVAPSGSPLNNTLWLSTDTSSYGIFEWNAETVQNGGQVFTNKTPIVILDETKLDDFTIKSSYPAAAGTYAVAPMQSVDPSASSDDRSVLTYFFKTAYCAKSHANDTAPYNPVDWVKWVKLGSDDWVSSWPVATATTSTNPAAGSSMKVTTRFVGNVDADDKLDFTVDTSTGASLADCITAINTASPENNYVWFRLNSSNKVEIYALSTTVKSVKLENVTGTPVASLGFTAGKEYYAPEFTVARHTDIPQWKDTDNKRPSGSIWVKSTTPNKGAQYQVKLYNNDTQLWQSLPCPIYTSNAEALYYLDRVGGGANLSANTVYASANTIPLDAAIDYIGTVGEFRIKRRSSGKTSFMTKVIGAATLASGVNTFTLAESVTSSATMDSPKSISFDADGTYTDADLLALTINSAGFKNITASVDSLNRVIITHELGGEIEYVDGTSTPLADLSVVALGGTTIYKAPLSAPNTYIVSNWHPETTSITTGYTASRYFISSGVPSTILTEDSRLWYNSTLSEVDILVHDGTSWRGYKNVFGTTDSAGPIISASKPTKLSDGSSLVKGQLWIDTSDLPNYPVINRWNSDLLVWELVDKSDQTTENGIVFADARAGTSGGTSTSAPAGTISELLTSNYLDPDAPDPALYPKGMLLWNLRRSGYNVKRFVRDYIDQTATNSRYTNESMASYYAHRWVTESSNQYDGAGTFGSNAQRQVIIQRLQSAIATNQDLRETESRRFNLISCPGYYELIPSMISLNYDRGLSAFVIGDSPARLDSSLQSLANWGNEVDLTIERQSAVLSTYNEYLGVFYPWGLTSDNFGRSIAVPSSHMILRTIALSDQVSYPWFAPAGTRRGTITNASTVGYVTSEGEFKSITLNERQRDVLYNTSVNPITFLSGAGLVNYGQKTRAVTTSSLDRINVARLVVYLRTKLNDLARPYIFEPNDKFTRDQLKHQVESLMIELIGQRAIGDFLVVCDETNNTPTTIDRNELYVDIAIEPIKAVEFIYIPLRLKNTGEIAGLGSV